MASLQPDFINMPSDDEQYSLPGYQQASCGHFAETGMWCGHSNSTPPVLLLRHIENSNGFTQANLYQYYRNIILKTSFQTLV